VKGAGYPHIRAWSEKVPQPKELIVLETVQLMPSFSFRPTKETAS